MILVKTRSSRLFVVSLHLLGVSTHFTSTWRDGGILGVNTQSIVLEISDPLSVLNDEQRSQNQPIWLQDSIDQTCLEPNGIFSECGDASFWFVIPKKRRQSSRLNWFRWAEEELGYDRDSSPDGYALQPADSYSFLSLTVGNVSQPLKARTSEDIAERECLTRSRKDNTLILAPCIQERSWSWQFNENGILYFEKKKGKSRGTPKAKRLLGKQKILECVGKNSTDAVIFPCNGRPSSAEKNGTRAVQMVVVQQIRASSSGVRPLGMEGTIDDRISEEPQVVEEKDEKPPIHYPPSYVDIAHIHASSAAVHAQLNAGSSRRASLSRPKEPTAEKEPVRLPLQFLVDTNPILLANTESSSPSRLGTERIKIEMKIPNAGTTLPKIKMNPYVANSQNNMWTDPKTGLVYPTDLCNYLGYTRKEAGRHTLTGVGQFMKTAFNIKVGIE